MGTYYGRAEFSSGIHYYNIPDTSTVDYYFLRSPFDLENRKFKYKLDPRNRIARADNLKITNDGRQLYVCETLGDVLNYKLTMPFRLNTAVYDYTVTGLFSGREANCFEITNNGTKFYYNQSGSILQFDLSIPYDIRSRTQTGSYGGFPTSGPGDPAFSPDGLKMVVGARNRNYIEGGTLTTPFDLNTFTSQHTFTTPNVDPSCCKWNHDGTVLFVRHSSPDMVNKFVTSNPYSLVGMSFSGQVFNNTSYAAGGHDFNYEF